MLFHKIDQTKFSRLSIIEESVYDENYFMGSNASSYQYPCDWTNRNKHYRDMAKFIITGFPEIKSILDVGTGMGNLLHAFQIIKNAMKWDYDIEGFDVSSYACENMHEVPKQLTTCESVDSYCFKRDFDMVIFMHVLEHLTEAQAIDFVERSRENTGIAVCFIHFANSKPTPDPTQISLKDREYWINMFSLSGWERPVNLDYYEYLANESSFLKQKDVELLLFAGKKANVELYQTN